VFEGLEEPLDFVFVSLILPDIPTKSYTCMSTSWLLGNVYTAKSCRGEQRAPDTLKLGLVS